MIDFEVVDPMMVPREWCDPNETRIRAQVKATGLRTEIPGVRVFERSIARTRR